MTDPRDQLMRDLVRQVRRVTLLLVVGGFVMLALWIALTAGAIR